MEDAKKLVADIYFDKLPEFKADLFAGMKARTNAKIAEQVLAIQKEVGADKPKETQV